MEQENNISNLTESESKTYFSWQSLFIGVFICIMLFGAYQAIFGDKRDKMMTIALDGSITEYR